MENQQTRDEIQELYATVHGRVQGVGFRYFVVENALSMNLRGYTRNEDDDSVSVLAQGPRPVLERFVALLWQGPSAADVSKVETNWRDPSTHVSGFHVRW